MWRPHDLANVPEQLFVDQICSSSCKFGHWPPFFRVIGRILLEYAAVPRVTTNQIAALRSNGHFPRFLEIRGWHTKVADFLKNSIGGAPQEAAPPQVGVPP